MIPDNTIARVRESVDLVELIRESVQGLKKTGRNFSARCPFHQERTPSFHVNPDMGVFKCFGCGVGGDAFKFVMLTEGMTYPEAIRKLATRVGITIEETERETQSAEAKERDVLYSLLEEAAKFFHRYLMESPEAASALDYLRKRGVTDESLEKYQIGFAPMSGHALRDAATRKGHDVSILEKAGLLRRKEDGRVHDHFWNRIMFPIWDSQGHMIAFGGRAMGDALPKYINSPETPVYSKSRHMYGFYQALPTIRKKREIVILEGYMDVVVCHQFGFDGSVATLGTALTDSHVKLLKRYVESVTMLFDPDAAGANATLRGGELLIAEGLTVRVVTLPDGLDPDEILVQRGNGALEQYLATAVPFMDYYIAQMLARHPHASPEGKLAVAKEVLPLVRRIKDPLLQDEHLTKLAEALHADKGALARQMKLMHADAEWKDAKSAKPVDAPKTTLQSIEEEILILALLYPSAQAAERIDALLWKDARCQQAWDVLKTQVDAGAVKLTELLPSLSEDLQGWLMALALQQRSYTKPLENLQAYIDAYERQDVAIALQHMKADIDSMLEGRIPMDAQKVQIYHDLSRRLKGSVH